MNFSEALELINGGKKVRRSCWNDPNDLIDKNSLMEFNHAIGSINLFGLDWEEYKEPLQQQSQPETSPIKLADKKPCMRYLVQYKKLNHIAIGILYAENLEKLMVKLKHDSQTEFTILESEFVEDCNFGENE